MSCTVSWKIMEGLTREGMRTCSQPPIKSSTGMPISARMTVTSSARDTGTCSALNAGFTGDDAPGTATQHSTSQPMAPEPYHDMKKRHYID